MNTAGDPRVWDARLIAAYVQRYREAGRWKALTWTGAAALFAAGVLLAALGTRGSGLAVAAAVYVLATRVVMSPETTAAHEQAVRLQEEFDVSMFALGWNHGLAGGRPAEFEIAELADRARGGVPAPEEWYVDAGTAPQPMAVLLRQLENVTWGRRDQERFLVVTLIVFLCSASTTVVLGLIQDLSLQSYVATLLVPALPWLLDLADLVRLHARATRRRRGIERKIRALWALPTIAEPADLRSIQDSIFRVRRDTGRVPTWFYRRYRRRNARAFEEAANELLRRRGWEPSQGSRS